MGLSMVRKSMKEELLEKPDRKKYVSGLADAVVVGRVSGKLDAKQDIDEDDEELDLDLVERLSGTSLFAFICNDDLVMVADGRSVSSLFARVVKEDEMKIYWIYKSVYALGTGTKKTLRKITQEMKTRALDADAAGKQIIIISIARYMAMLANTHAIDICGFILGGRLQSNDTPEIFEINFKEDENEGGYTYYPQPDDRIPEWTAKGSGQSYMSDFMEGARERMKRIKANRDLEDLKNFARDVIGEARIMHYCTDGNVNLVALFHGRDPIYQTAVPLDANNARAGYTEWVDSTDMPHFLP